MLTSDIIATEDWMAGSHPNGPINAGPPVLQAATETMADAANSHACGIMHMDIKPNNILLTWQRVVARGDDAILALKLMLMLWI